MSGTCENTAISRRCNEHVAPGTVFLQPCLVLYSKSQNPDLNSLARNPATGGNKCKQFALYARMKNYASTGKNIKFIRSDSVNTKIINQTIIRKKMRWCWH